jgi:hypothetical protein
MADIARFADIGGIQGARPGSSLAHMSLRPAHVAMPCPRCCKRTRAPTAASPHHSPPSPPAPSPAGYTINSSKVIFLRRRPQPRPPKGAVGASLCSVCSRHLQDVSQFCSLQCKLDCLAGVKHVSLRKLAPGAAAAASSAAGSEGGSGAALSSGSSSGRSSGGAPVTPSHLDALRALEAVTSSDSECM